VLNVTSFRFIAGIAFILLCHKSFSQRWELGAFAGGANYSGDLARRFVLKETNFAAGVLGKCNVSEYFALRTGFNYARVSGGDYNFSEYRLRNLSFFTRIIEWDNRLEFNYLRFGTSARAKRSTGYVFAGINLYHFNPRTEYNGSVIELQPLTTEGQLISGKRTYSRISMSVPFGLGYKYSLGRNLVVAFEVAMRKTFTDYLDDVSGAYPDFTALEGQKGAVAAAVSDRSAETDPFRAQAAPGDYRGNPALKDWYMTAGITITYRFTPVLCSFLKY
jgi:hypothetical protein